MSIAPDDDVSGRELLLSFRQSYDSYQEFVAALHNPAAPHIYRLVGLHLRLYQSDPQYKNTVRGSTTTDVKSNLINDSGGIHNTKNVNVNITHLSGLLNTGDNSTIKLSKQKRRDRTLQGGNKPDIPCAHTCTKCLYKIRYDNTQDLCRRHMLRYKKKHTHCNYNCEVYNYINHDCKQQHGVPLWCEIAAHVFKDNRDQYESLTNRHKQHELNTPAVLKLIAEHCIDQICTHNNHGLFHDNQYSESLCELVKHINPSIVTKILTSNENNTSQVEISHLTTPADTMSSDQLLYQQDEDQAGNAVPVSNHNTNYVIPDSSLLTATSPITTIATDATDEHTIDTATESGILYTNQRLTRSQSKLSTTSEQTNVTTPTVRKLSRHTGKLTLNSTKKTTASDNLHAQRKLAWSYVSLPSISTYLKCWKQIEPMCTKNNDSLSFSAVSQCIDNQQDATRINNLRFDCVKNIMKRYSDLVSTVYKTQKLKKQWRGIELLLYWSNLSAANHITELAVDARITFANMLVTFDVEHGEMFNANVNLTRQSDMPDQLINYAYMLFVLKQLHQPKYHSVLKWLQTECNFQSQLDYKRYIDGISELSNKMKLHTMKDIIGMESVCTTITKTMKYCTQCKRMSKCQCGRKYRNKVYDYELITTGMCKVAILEYLNCNILLNDEILQLDMFDSVINDVVTQFQSMENVGLFVSEWQAYFATHIIYAHTLYGTQPINKLLQYQKVIEYIIESLNSFIRIGHVEVIGEYAATLRLAGYVEEQVVLNGILYILAQVNKIGEVITSEMISSRIHKHVNFKVHVQWCAINALIPLMTPITSTF